MHRIFKNDPRRQLQHWVLYYFLFSALIKYTFSLFYGIILKNKFIKGGYHEDRFGFGCTNQRKYFDPQNKFWQNLDFPQRSCGSKENPDGHLSRAQRYDHRRDLQAVQLQNQKILLRHPTFCPGEQHRSLNTEKDWAQKRPKRTPELEKRIIQLRLTTDKNMYEMTRILNQEGFPVKSRLVAQILSEYGISKKKSLQKK